MQMFCARNCALINTMENRAISLVESSRDNESSRKVSPSLRGRYCRIAIACLQTHTPPATSLTEMHYGTHIVNLDM
jgi:hypothetical protein